MACAERDMNHHVSSYVSYIILHAPLDLKNPIQYGPNSQYLITPSFQLGVTPQEEREKKMKH